MTGLPAIDIRKDQTTGFTANEFKFYSEQVSQIQNAETLRGDLITLAKTRAKNAIGLLELDGLGIDKQIAAQANQTKQARLSAEISRTSIELLKVDELGIQGAILGTKIQSLNAQLSFETQALEQSKNRYRLELEKADIEIKELTANSSAAAKLAATKIRQTVTVPARRVA